MWSTPRGSLHHPGQFRVEVDRQVIDSAPHACSGGHPSGSYTDSHGPDASAAMVRFFLDGATDLPGA
jgi:hypothetical protein